MTFKPVSISPKHFTKSAIVTILLIAGFIVALEYNWRSKGYPISFNDDNRLWANERRKIYGPADRTTVFIGTSRTKFDIDIETWEKQTGEKAVQLALVGTAPRKILLDLANDEKFAGKVIMDVMEPSLFALDTLRSERFARAALDYYYDETPAQRASALLGFALESELVMFEEEKFGLNHTFRVLSQSNNRQGVIAAPIPFRRDYVYITERRQSKFSPLFLNSPDLIKAHEAHWMAKFIANRARMPIPKNKSLDSLCLVYKTAIDKITARGGSVVIIRPPSTGEHLVSENKLFPRKQYYERLIEITNTPAIHYADYPETAGMPCTEGSHLSPDDAVKYTSLLATTLQNEFGWKFPTTKKP